MNDEKSDINNFEPQERLRARYLDAEKSLIRMELERVDFNITIKSLLKAVIRLARHPVSSSWLAQLEEFVERSKFTLEEAESLTKRLSQISGLDLVEEKKGFPASASQGTSGQENLDKRVGERVKVFLTQIASHRGYRFNDEAQALIKGLEDGEHLNHILMGLTNLMTRFVQDYSEEKSHITGRLSSIIKTLMNTEDQFKRLIKQNIAFIDEENREFNESLTECLTQIQDSVQEVQEEVDISSDAEKLLTLIAVKVEALCQSIQEKTLQDEKRLLELQKEKVALESRLDTVRRDYDTFVTQSHKLLKELEDFKSISMRDALTGVYNRRAYDEAVNLSIENFKYNRLETFSLLIFDIDNFRDVNNSYGHQAGDSILTHMGRIVADLLRCDDFIFRYGGDEFICLLPQAKLSDAAKVAEKIRRAVEGVEFKLSRQSEKTIHISISMGVTEIRPGDNAISVLARADTALYVSKQNGRNRVTFD
jgi:diguanylate cyclase